MTDFKNDETLEDQVKPIQFFILSPAAIVYHNENVFSGYKVRFSPFVTSKDEAKHWWNIHCHCMIYDVLDEIIWPLHKNEDGQYTFCLHQESYPKRNKYGEIL